MKSPLLHLETMWDVGSYGLPVLSGMNAVSVGGIGHDRQVASLELVYHVVTLLLDLSTGNKEIAYINMRTCAYLYIYTHNDRIHRTCAYKHIHMHSRIHLHACTIALCRLCRASCRRLQRRRPWHHHCSHTAKPRGTEEGDSEVQIADRQALRRQPHSSARPVPP